MIRGESGKPIRLSGPNPYMMGQAPDSFFADGRWLNGSNFGVPVVVESDDRSLDLRSQIEKLGQYEREARLRQEEIRTPQEEGAEEVIRGLDGKPFNIDKQVNQQFDPESPDHVLMDDVDQEAIERGGAPVEYHRMIVDANVHDFYLEQRQKNFSTKIVEMYAHYEPVQPQWNPMGGTALFSSDESQMFSFNRREFLEKVREMPREGSLIKTCTDGVFWEIIRRDVNIEGEDRKLWGRHRIVCLCQKYQATATDSSPTKRGREAHLRGDDEPIKIR